MCTQINNQSWIQHYNTNCIPRPNSDDLTDMPCNYFEPEPLNSFSNIDVFLEATFEEEPLEAYFWQQSTLPSLWNLYGTDVAREGRGLDTNDPVFGQ